MKLKLSRKSLVATALVALLVTGTIATAASAHPSNKIAVNLTVTNVPVSITKASKLESVIRVCVLPLPSDATAVIDESITSCSSKRTYETKAASLADSTWSGSLSISAPKTAGESRNYAMYVQVRHSSKLGLATQYGLGQFVTISNVDGTPTVASGLDGLTVDLSANAGSGAISKVIPVSVPDDGNSYAILVTKIGDTTETAVAYIPVTVADTQVTLPSNLKGGNYRVQLIQISAGDTFTLDSKAFLDAPIEHLGLH